MKNKLLILAFILCTLTVVVFASSCTSGTKGLEFVDINDDECGVKCGEAINESEIVIPKKHNGKTVTTIMSTAFSKCEKLVSVTIPKTVTKMDKGAFYNCTSLENVYYKGSVKDWCKIDFVLGNSSPMGEAENFFAKGKEITELKLKDIETIKQYAFFGFDNLERFTADDSLKSIGENAFAGCSKLNSVTLPSSLEKLDKLCFSNCSSLKEITIPYNTYQIHTLAFYESGIKTLAFENTEKWFTTNSATATKGDKIDVTSPEQNVKALKNPTTSYWKRVLPTT